MPKTRGVDKYKWNPRFEVWWYGIPESTSSTIEVKLHIPKSLRKTAGVVSNEYKGYALTEMLFINSPLQRYAIIRGCTGTVERQSTAFGRIKTSNVQTANEQGGEHSASLSSDVTLASWELGICCDNKHLSPLMNKLSATGWHVPEIQKTWSSPSTTSF